MSTLEAADFEAPSSHPELGGSYPHNTFTVMPVRGVSVAKPGDVLDVNIASYTDPYSELDFHRLVAARPRWQHVLKGLQLDEVELLEHLLPYNKRIANRSSWRPRPFHWAADRAFKGSVALKDQVVGAVGVLHPEKWGWVKLDTPELDMRNIADFKQYLGSISAQEADAHRKSRHLYGIFNLPKTVITIDPFPREVTETREFS